MALDQSALLDLLGQLKLTDVSDRIRTATKTLYQQLNEAQRSSAPPLSNAPRPERPSATGPVPGR